MAPASKGACKNHTRDLKDTYYLSVKGTLKFSIDDAHL